MAWLKIKLDGIRPIEYKVGKNKVSQRMAEKIEETNGYYDEAQGKKAIRTIEEKVFGPSNNLLGIRTTNEQLLIDGTCRGKTYTSDNPLVLSRTVEKEAYKEGELVAASETDCTIGGIRVHRYHFYGKDKRCDANIWYNQKGLPKNR